jgi:hypothetical protein
VTSSGVACAMVTALMRRIVPVLAVVVIACDLTACSPRKIGINRMADALSSTASSYSRDDDPEFVRLAAPSTLKMVEMLLDDQPSHAGLLMTACTGFTQYAFGFLHADAERAEGTSTDAAREARSRAARMYERARDYCARALELRHPGIGARLKADASGALASTTVADVPALFWTAVSTGGAVALADNQLLRIGQLATVRALLARALALDETWERGAIHEALIPLDGLPFLMGGSAARAREHFDRAVQLSNGKSAFAYVAMAVSVAGPAGDRAEYARLLRAALAIDPSQEPSIRLANLLAQRRARFLLGDGAVQ